MASIADIANPFGVPSQGLWNLLPGIYVNANNKSVQFYTEVKDTDPAKKTAIDQTTDSGGRRIATYEYPYKDGQALQDLGRKGFTFTFNIKFFGLNYQQLFKEFYDVVIDAKGTGTLIHPTLSPVFGALSVRFKDFEFIHRHDEYNAITIKATFIEDTTQQLKTQEISQTSSDSALRSGLQFLVDTQATISQLISEASALLLLPSAIQAGLQNRITSITGQISRLFGQLGATFSTDSSIHSLSQSAQNLTGGVASLSSGTTTLGQSTQTLPPVFQVGFDPTTEAAIQNNLSAFVNANQVTQQQAVFSANQSRANITTAISELELSLGNYAADAVLKYRQLAVTIQTTVETIIASQTKVIVFLVTEDMSLRRVAFLNGLDPDRQNEIESLNPYLGSINFVPSGTTLILPAA